MLPCCPFEKSCKIQFYLLCYSFLWLALRLQIYHFCIISTHLPQIFKLFPRINVCHECTHFSVQFVFLLFTTCYAYPSPIWPIILLSFNFPSTLNYRPNFVFLLFFIYDPFFYSFLYTTFLFCYFPYCVHCVLYTAFIIL